MSHHPLGARIEIYEEAEMYNFTDRQPTLPNRRKITPEGGEPFYATVEMADEPTVAGTPVTRAGLMAIQGMENSTTVFNSDGSITETFNNGTVNSSVHGNSS